MSRIAYVDGRYVPHRHAAVHVEDRGYQFADAVYEVIAVRHGQLIDEEPHLHRLARSLAELRIPPVMPDNALRVVLREVVRRNGVRNGIVYLQISRGAAPRDHQFPKQVHPVLVVTSRRQAPKKSLRLSGVDVISQPDIRWLRRDIKSVSLLPNVLAKQAAVEAGAYEAWLVGADGTVSEGTATNAWIVTNDNELVTRRADHMILDGITRKAVIAAATEAGYTIVERPFTLEEAKQAKECFLTSTTSWVMPVISIDAQSVGNGQPGELTRSLQELYAAHMGGE